MLVWLGAVLFVVMGAALLLAREPLARGLALTVGGRIGAGCVIAIAVAFFIAALLVIFFRELLA